MLTRCWLRTPSTLKGCGVVAAMRGGSAASVDLGKIVY